MSRSCAVKRLGKGATLSDPLNSKRNLPRVSHLLGPRRRRSSPHPADVAKDSPYDRRGPGRHAVARGIAERGAALGPSRAETARGFSSPAWTSWRPVTTRPANVGVEKRDRADCVLPSRKVGGSHPRVLALAAHRPLFSITATIARMARCTEKRGIPIRCGDSADVIKRAAEPVANALPYSAPRWLSGRRRPPAEHRADLGSFGADPSRSSRAIEHAYNGGHRQSVKR